MFYILFLYAYKCSDLDFILYKKVRIRSIPYSNLVLTEKISDFSKNVFYTSDEDHLTSDFNDISRIEKIKDKYKVKIGNFYVCKGQTWRCSRTSSNDRVCIDKNNNEVDCEMCRIKAIEQCEKDIDLWDIERTSLGFVIKYEDSCLTLGHQLKLQSCEDNKNQLFGFEDYEMMSCLLKLSNKSKPENYKDLLDVKKLDKMIKEIKSPALKKALLKKKNKKENFDDFVEKEMPELKDKPKMKRMWGSLWDSNFKRPNFDWNYPEMKFFCSKWF
ncbi:hypothetical protein NBO_462g0001 [Nosema bombycis CQ1]|uniref:Uncharacterized protein n=1 Tax=Nosema bombycis (strain CQ1 / CVCC 102059) TaxID=578461 RepID=R0KQ50_NOSB1|nr:hypothetical protein NBO_462g0001 [Nosema bombycis CQ1]|eukprot:EOB12332.1 hypothetical protein NBO_462g0001 [Nosema bombycis CQ1]